jgi:hypothetical protein
MFIAPELTITFRNQDYKLRAGIVSSDTRIGSSEPGLRAPDQVCWNLNPPTLTAAWKILMLIAWRRSILWLTILESYIRKRVPYPSQFFSSLYLSFFSLVPMLDCIPIRIAKFYNGFTEMYSWIRP